MLIHRRVTPSSKFVGTHLYTWVERGTVRVKCLTQEHNAVPWVQGLNPGRSIWSPAHKPVGHRASIQSNINVGKSQSPQNISNKYAFTPDKLNQGSTYNPGLVLISFRTTQLRGQEIIMLHLHCI